MSAAMNERIALRAYQIWIDEGRPHGRDVEHWLQARREIEVEASPSHGEGRMPDPEQEAFTAAEEAAEALATRALADADRRSRVGPVRRRGKAGTASAP